MFLDMLDDPDNEYPYEIWYTGGLFHSSSAEEGYYSPDDLPTKWLTDLQASSTII